MGWNVVRGEAMFRSLMTAGALMCDEFIRVDFLEFQLTRMGIFFVFCFYPILQFDDASWFWSVVLCRSLVISVGS